VLGGTVRTRRAVALVEALAAAGIFAFVVASTGLLFQAVMRKQTAARDLSRGLTEQRRAIALLSKVGRHALRVVPSTPEFGNAASGANQLIVEVPEPTGRTPATVLVRFHVAGGVLHKQRSDQAAPGTPILDGVASVSYRYFHNRSGERIALPGDVYGVATSIGGAREVEATVVVASGKTTVRNVVDILLRNVPAGW